jgi:hypothetical protein
MLWQFVQFWIHCFISALMASSVGSGIPDSFQSLRRVEYSNKGRLVDFF